MQRPVARLWAAVAADLPTRLDSNRPSVAQQEPVKGASARRDRNVHTRPACRVPHPAVSLGHRTTLMSEFENVESPLCRRTSTLIIRMPTLNNTNSCLCPDSSNSMPAVVSIHFLAVYVFLLIFTDTCRLPSHFLTIIANLFQFSSKIKGVHGVSICSDCALRLALTM